MGGLFRAGEAERLVTAGGRRYVVGMRVFTLVPLGLVAVTAADGLRMRLSVLAAVALLAGWSALYVRRVQAGSVTWPTVLDAAVLVGLAVATPWLVSDAWLAASSSWIRPFIAFAAVGYQYSTPWPVGVGLGGLLCVTGAVTTQLAQPGPPGPDGFVTAGWSFLTVLLARLMWTLVVRAGRKADAIFAAANEARRSQAVAAGLRSDQRAVTNALHDTAASTLLMVGLGQVGGAEKTLRLRAEHDLATLLGLRSEQPAAATVDLCGELRQLGEREAVGVVFDVEQLEIASEVAQALAGATGEAVANVRRHAGTELVAVEVSGTPSRIRVEIRDQGRGFDVDTVPTTRRGLRESIRGRLTEVGGAAEVESTPGVGTVVRLRWPDE